LSARGPGAGRAAHCIGFATRAFTPCLSMGATRRRGPGAGRAPRVVAPLRVVAALLDPDLPAVHGVPVHPAGSPRAQRRRGRLLPHPAAQVGAGHTGAGAHRQTDAWCRCTLLDRRLVQVHPDRQTHGARHPDRHTDSQCRCCMRLNPHLKTLLPSMNYEAAINVGGGF
jgi:hypothetical protein